jgi:hypothetical protein
MFEVNLNWLKIKIFRRPILTREGLFNFVFIITKSMFFTSQINFDDPLTTAKYEFKQSIHLASWEHYYRIYNQAFSLAIRRGLSKNYQFNGASHGLMFLLRQVVELNLKYNLALNGIDVPNTHSIPDLLAAFTDQATVPEAFKQAILIFMEDEDGGCWRYHADKDGCPYFKNSDTIKLADILKNLNAVEPTDKFTFEPVCAPFAYESRKVVWAMTLHIGFGDDDWFVKGGFDVLTIMLIEEIANCTAVVKDVYLPLLFNVRHAIELALKGNILTIRDGSDAISDKDIGSEHSLCGLYNIFKDYLDTVDWTQLSPQIQEQYQTYRAEYDKLNKALHDLDSHSRAFRYPFDTNGIAHRVSLTKNDIRKILRLYQLTDPFITFTTNVLIDNGILPFEPDNIT